MWGGIMPNNIIYSGFHEAFEIVYRKEKCLFPMPPHTHNAIEIYLNLTDLPSILLGKNVFPMKKNVLFIIPSYCIHQMMTTKDKAYERYILTINTSWINNVFSQKERSDFEYLKDSQNPLILFLTEKEKKELMNKFDKLIQCSNDNVFGRMEYFFEVMSSIHHIVATVNKEIAEQHSKHLSGTAKTVSEIVDYINSHFCENLTVKEIADHFYLNHDYIARIFKRHVNTTIKNFITIQRITKAQQLLLEGNTITQTQVKTGYTSYEHFFRTFKKITGRTPKEYQKQYFSGKRGG